MVQKISAGFCTLSLLPLIRALVFTGPSSTAAAHHPLRLALPEATPGFDSEIKGLHQRADTYDSYTGGSVDAATSTYVSWASASVCGFVEGVLDYSSEIACVGYEYGFPQCLFHTAGPSYPAMVGCCDNAYTPKCRFKTTCYDSEQVANTPTLTESTANAFAVLCTRPTAASCVQWTYPGLSITDYGCSNIETTQTVYLSATPYSHNIPDRSSVSYVGGIPTVGSVVGSLVYDSFISDYVDSKAASSGISSAPAASTTSTGSSSGSSSGSNSASGQSTSHSSSNTGVIAGGAVGGVVGLAGIGAAIFMFIKMQRKKKSQRHEYEPALGGDSAAPPPLPSLSVLPSPSEVDGSSFHNYVAVDPYKPDHNFHSAPLPQEMDARNFVAELPASPEDSRPVSSMNQRPISYTSGPRH
ncbi:uncharacterized protein N7482_000498 [Penicillium canariense]|uniref:Uncharacterized protein n=1 Tax=Penicillium canariense TaxID=189055 RepID=A0A9W9LS75_9EURO|nr:uncharacterized protein N7482_000498 [Penicillium canariense]KAJ5174621.1 hypothetical protein N7482_000498 [Penicillium canariense]